jgi:hypothetical protein
LKEDYEANFFNSFGPFDGIKRDVWEGGVRVPTIASWPGHIPANRIVQSPSGVYDWLPTFAEAAGVPAPARVDGVSLMPSLTGTGKQKNSLVYVEYFNGLATPDFAEFDPHHRKRRRNQMQLIRVGDTLGVRYDIKSNNDDFEIYNVVKDPKETKNLATSSQLENLQNKMKERVLQLRRPDTSAKRPYDKELIPATSDKKTKAGIIWKAYKGNFPWIPEVSTLTAESTGTALQPFVDVKKGVDNGVLYFYGYLKIPEDGEYTFFLSANAAAFFRIHQATVIDADFGYKATTERSGAIRLKAGLHPFRLYYSSKAQANPLLDFKWEGKGISKQPIPSTIFCHE